MRARWLGRVNYRDALALQEGLFAHSSDDYLLLLEHHHVFTYGASADLADRQFLAQRHPTDDV
jgi:lipoic acid synthetase